MLQNGYFKVYSVTASGGRIFGLKSGGTDSEEEQGALWS